MDNINLLIFLTGTVSLIVSALGNYFTYVFSIINIVVYSAITIYNGLYVDGVTNLILLLPLYIIGIISWKKNSRNESLEIEKMTMINWILYVILIIVGVWTLRYLFRLTWVGSGHIQPVITILTLVSELIMIERCYEHWYFRMFIYGFRIYLWGVAYLSGSGNTVLVTFLIVNFIISVYGLNRWKKVYEQKNAH